MGIRAVTPSGPSALPGLAGKPPKFGDYLALHFDRAASRDTAGYASDFRPSLDADEEWWDFTIRNSATGLAQADLVVPGLEGLRAAGLYAFIVQRGQARLLEPGTPAALALEGPDTRYGIVITSHADFAERLKGAFSISQNFPNPVVGYTTFKFYLPQTWDKDGKRDTRDYRLRLDVYDYQGRLAARVADGAFKPGPHALTWKAQAKGGGELAKGAYLYRLEAAGMAKTMKMIVK